MGGLRFAVFGVFAVQLRVRWCFQVFVMRLVQLLRVFDMDLNVGGFAIHGPAGAAARCRNASSIAASLAGEIRCAQVEHAPCT